MRTLPTLSFLSAAFILATPAQAAEFGPEQEEAAAEAVLLDLDAFPETEAEFTHEEDAESELEIQIDPMDDAIGDRHRKRVYRRRVYRHRHRPRYYHRSRALVVGHHHRHHVPRARVVATERRDTPVSLGLRFSALSVGNTELSYENFEGATLGGIGAYLRARMTSNWGIEFAADILGNTDQDYEQLSFPAMAGLMLHLFPESTFDIYGVAGGGLVYSQIDYQPMLGDGARNCCSESFTQFGGQLGAGLELNLGALELITDVRWLFLQPRPERDPETRSLAPLDTTSGRSAGPDDLTHALQFTLGVGGNF